MPGLDDEQREEYTHWFAHYARNKSAVGANELGFILRALGQNPSGPEVQDILKDFGQGNQCTQDGFLKYMESKYRECNSERDIVEAFQVFDKDGKGHITCTELRHIMSNLGEKLSDEEVNAMVAEAFPDDDGQMDYGQFVQMMIQRGGLG
eukprot:TRINITY_DN1475_c1_g1_i1.p1 TRINITY_DN1475_c1_g1~~TRINITY_DN1475_c1_g1_i1.p1  ORF type:complete len:164 (+),score=28.14 TRINITY_DN1475_c1_g1_i1:45-494(+)